MLLTARICFTCEQWKAATSYQVRCCEMSQQITNRQRATECEESELPGSCDNSEQPVKHAEHAVSWHKRAPTRVVSAGSREWRRGPQAGRRWRSVVIALVIVRRCHRPGIRFVNAAFTDLRSSMEHSRVAAVRGSPDPALVLTAGLPRLCCVVIGDASETCGLSGGEVWRPAPSTTCDEHLRRKQLADPFAFGHGNREVVVDSFLTETTAGSGGSCRTRPGRWPAESAGRPGTRSAPR